MVLQYEGKGQEQSPRSSDHIWLKGCPRLVPTCLLCQFLSDFHVRDSHNTQVHVLVWVNPSTCDLLTKPVIAFHI